MSWSYTGDPQSSAKDEVRFLIGDTNPKRQFLQDEEINYHIRFVSDPPPTSGNFLAAAYCAEQITARFSFLVDKSVGDLHISYSQQVKAFAALAQMLRTRATMHGVKVYSGGLSLAEKLANSRDTDLPKAEILVDGMNYASSFNPNDPGVP